MSESLFRDSYAAINMTTLEGNARQLAKVLDLLPDMYRDLRTNMRGSVHPSLGSPVESLIIDIENMIRAFTTSKRDYLRLYDRALRAIQLNHTEYDPSQRKRDTDILAEQLIEFLDDLDLHIQWLANMALDPQTPKCYQTEHIAHSLVLSVVWAVMTGDKTYDPLLASVQDRDMPSYTD